MSGLYKVCLLREVSFNFSRSTLYIMALENDVKSVEFLLNHGIPQFIHIKAIFTTYHQEHHHDHDHLAQEPIMIIMIAQVPILS